MSMREGTLAMEHFVRAIVFLFLIISLGFVAYLYPLPDQNIMQIVSTMTPAEASRVRAAMEPSYWASWMTNLFLLVIGTFSALLWLVNRHGWQRKLAVAGVILFSITCVVVLLWQGDDSGVINTKVTLLKQLSAAQAWSFLAAEVHRLLATVVGLTLTVLLTIYLRRAGS
jgi:glucan phosphoethanolaminetransferase (alkaline phosphatase superfamily)